MALQRSLKGVPGTRPESWASHCSLYCLGAPLPVASTPHLVVGGLPHTGVAGSTR